MTTIAIITAALLSVYLCTVVAVMLIPPRQHDPQRGVGVGCLMFVALALAAVLAALIVAEIYHVRWLVYVTFGLAVFPVIPMTGMAVMWVARKSRHD